MRVSIFTTGILAAALALSVPAAAQRGPGVEEAGAEQRVAPIGLVLNPTAYVLPKGQWLIGGGMFQQAVATGTTDRQFSAGIYQGVTDDLQLGAFWVGVRRERPTGGRVTDSFFGGAGQWKFVDESAGMSLIPSVALGGYAYGGKGSGGTAYLVASKNLMNEVRPGAVFLHGGARWDTFSDTLDDNAIRPFFGGNILLTQELSLNGEWRQKHFGERHNVWAAGATYLIGGGYAISAGFEDLGAGKSKIYTGLSIIP